MKCPKCKYIAFDYLESCPRCGKDMSAEKAKLNIFSIKPNPPSLLGSLTGDLDDSRVELSIPEPIGKGAEDMKLKGDEIFDDGSELDINLDEAPMSEPGEKAQLDLGDLGFSDDDKEAQTDLLSDDVSQEVAEGGVEEDVGDEGPGFEEGGDQESAQEEEAEKKSEELDVDLGDLDLKLDLDEDDDSNK